LLIEPVDQMSVRRTWDKELYAEKARVRAETAAQQESEELLAEDLVNIKKRKLDAAASADTKEEFRSADHGASGPLNSERAYLKARTTNVTEQLEEKVGTTQVVTSQAMEMGVGGGFWCETCSCLLKDSVAYLNHINGKKHQRALGFSMRVESVGVDSVKDRLAARLAEHKSKLSLSKKNNSGDDVMNAAAALEEHDAKLEDVAQQQSAKKKAKKEAKLAATKAAALRNLDDDDGDVDPEIAALMGFNGGFGSKIKKK
jgi:U4/U6.U5 tri-snRNP component SNU23